MHEVKTQIVMVKQFSCFVVIIRCGVEFGFVFWWGRGRNSFCSQHDERAKSLVITGLRRAGVVRALCSRLDRDRKKLARKI